jgi:hypothetical protein
VTQLLHLFFVVVWKAISLRTSATNLPYFMLDFNIIIAESAERKIRQYVSVI